MVITELACPPFAQTSLFELCYSGGHALNTVYPNQLVGGQDLA